jgi:hypothetical protein
MMSAGLDAAECLSNALRSTLDDGTVTLITKAVVVIEAINEHGERTFQYYRSNETAAWDAIGLMAFATEMIKDHSVE